MLVIILIDFLGEGGELKLEGEIPVLPPVCNPAWGLFFSGFDVVITNFTHTISPVNVMP